MNNQVVTISFFRFKGLRNKFWALAMMQRAHKIMKQSQYGDRFYKLLGTGADDGFSWKPNFSVYGLLAVWDDMNNADNFISMSELIADYRYRSCENLNFYLKPIKSQGKWSGINPFTSTSNDVPVGKVAVLTRATIRRSKLFSFWHQVSGASDSLSEFRGKEFSIGIGELPWIQQATFSIWGSIEHMKDYAYKNQVHRQIIQMTREKNWYKEELFARFTPIKVEGTWNGVEFN